ncbi:MAG: hypothetical protein ACTS73_08975 [Arsenophonus sp. NEOnobi-MAG3]
MDNNKSLQQAFIDMRNVVTDFTHKYYSYAHDINRLVICTR